MNKKLLLSIFAGTLMLSAGSAFAKSNCSSYGGSAVGGASVAAQQADNQAYKDVYDVFKKSTVDPTDPINSGIPGIAGISSCMDAWPSGSFNFSIPTIDSVINGVANAAVNKACSAARDKIASATSGLSDGVSLNTGIPGMPNLSASSSVGTGGGGVNSNVGSQASAAVNSVVNGWDQIQGLF